MSCPHPRGAIERIVGDSTEIVCPDCHELVEGLPVLPPSAQEILEAELDYVMTADDTLICGRLNRSKTQACGLAPEHEGNHDYTVDVVD